VVAARVPVDNLKYRICNLLTMGTDREQAVVANRARLLAQTAPPPPVPADMADDLLRATACARCGYDLNGLPLPSGTCPECGRPYGGIEVCLYGYGAGSKRTDWTRRPLTRRQLAWRWTWSAGIVAALLACWPLRWLFGGMYWEWLTSIAVGLAIVTWRGLGEQPLDAVQVWLTPAGVKQLNRRWGPIPYDRIDRAKPVPWRKVRRADVRPHGDGEVQVTLSNDAPFWLPERNYVEAVVRCAPDAAVALRQRIESWRAAAIEP
jgi:hypothetical protein